MFGEAVLVGTTMAGSQCVVGSVVALWRYPIKSMQGEELDSSEVTEHGLLGDRRFALVDGVDGKVVSTPKSAKMAHTIRVSGCLRGTAARRPPPARGTGAASGRPSDFQ